MPAASIAKTRNVWPPGRPSRARGERQGANGPRSSLQRKPAPRSLAAKAKATAPRPLLAVRRSLRGRVVILVRGGVRSLGRGGGRPRGDRRRGGFRRGIGGRVGRAEAVRIALLDDLAIDRGRVGAVLGPVDLGGVEPGPAIDEGVGIRARGAGVGEDRVVALAGAVDVGAGPAEQLVRSRVAGHHVGEAGSLGVLDPARTVSAPAGQLGCPPPPTSPARWVA